MGSPLYSVLKALMKRLHLRSILPSIEVPMSKSGDQLFKRQATEDSSMGGMTLEWLNMSLWALM